MSQEGLLEVWNYNWILNNVIFKYVGYSGENSDKWNRGQKILDMLWELVEVSLAEREMCEKRNCEK